MRVVTAYAIRGLRVNTLRGKRQGMGGGKGSDCSVYHKIQKVKSEAVRPKTASTYSNGEQ